VDQRAGQPAGARNISVARKADASTGAQASLGLLQIYAIYTLPEVVAAVVAEVTQAAVIYQVIMLHYRHLQDLSRDLCLKKFSSRLREAPEVTVLTVPPRTLRTQASVVG
jgi:hypothetical protein